MLVGKHFSGNHRLSFLVPPYQTNRF
ncbi:CRISPR-associated protein Cas5 [Maribacter algarum]